MDASGIRDLLLERDERFRALHHQHQALERQLRALSGKTVPQVVDERESRVIKKQKLLLKDLMQRITDEFVQGSASAARID